MQLLTGPFGLRLSAAILAGAWICGVPVATVQAQTVPPGLSDRTANISDQKLDAAAAALKQVIAVKEDYEKRIEAAPQPDKDRIAGEGNEALEKAVTNQGLSVEEYTAILVVAQTDPEVREKIVSRVRSSGR